MRAPLSVIGVPAQPAPARGAAANRPCPVCAQPSPSSLWTKDGYRIVQCAGCGLVYVGDDPASIDFAALYGEAYYRGGDDATFADYTGEEAQRRGLARRRLWWLRHLPPRLPRRGRLLDVGCAAGFFLAEAQAYYEVQGVELSAWAADWARRRYALPVATGTLHDAALPAASFDVVTLWDVIEHVAEPLPLLAEAARLMKPGAMLVLTTGDWDSAYARRRGAEWHLLTPPWHLTMFGRRTLADAARRAGLVPRAWRSEGVAGDGRFWRSRPGLALTRLLDRGDIVRATFVKP